MASDEAYIGSVEPWSGSFAPYNWAWCDGQILSLSQFDTLFAVIGTAFGGDGRTTFALPDMRGRVPLGAGTAVGGPTYILGTKAGVEAITLSAGQMPAHLHSAEFTPASGSALSASVALPVKTGIGSGNNDPVGKYFGGSGSTSLYYTDYTDGSTMAQVSAAITGQAATGVVTVGNAGASMPVPVLQPYLVLPFIICVAGMFPPRNN